MKVLVIDDEPDIRKIISEALRRRGFEAVTAGDADEAIAHFLAGGVDMITLDHRMPGMSGAELHELLSREFGAGKRTTGFVPKKLPPILIVTATPDAEEVIRAEFGEGVVGVLAKPFNIDQLVEIVQDTAGRHGSG